MVINCCLHGVDSVDDRRTRTMLAIAVVCAALVAAAVKLGADGAFAQAGLAAGTAAAMKRCAARAAATSITGPVRATRRSFAIRGRARGLVLHLRLSWRRSANMAPRGALLLATVNGSLPAAAPPGALDVDYANACK
jgi:hypothetical protein